VARARGPLLPLAGLPLGIDLTPLLVRLGASQQHGHASVDEAALPALDGRLRDDEVPPSAREWLSALQDAVARASASLRGLEELGGPVAEVRISGGWAANPVLRRLKIDAFPNAVHPRVVEAGARGAALLAGKAAGALASVGAFPPPLLADGLDVPDPSPPPSAVQPTEREPPLMSIANLPAWGSTTASSTSAAGKSYRLGRIFAGDGRTVILPVDHGTMLGRVAGLEDPVALIEAFLLLGCDGLLLWSGVAARTASLFATRSAPSRLLTIDTYWRGDSGAHVLTTSLERGGAARAARDGRADLFVLPAARGRGRD
jgi:FGGY family of carbohydrate kinases, C-terminal domain